MLEVVVDFIKTSRKAIVAFVLTAILAYVARKGLTVDAEVQESLRVLLEALIVAVTVWLVPNKQVK